MSRRPDLTMSAEDAAELLRRPLRSVLTTLDRRGFPHAVGMYHVVDDDVLRLSFWPYRKSQKVVNLRRDSRCSVLVEDGEPYVDLKGVLTFGRAEIIDDLDASRVLGLALYDRYFLPRTGMPAGSGPGQAIVEQSAKRVVVAMTPERIVSWDHSRTGK